MMNDQATAVEQCYLRADESAAAGRYRERTHGMARQPITSRDQFVYDVTRDGRLFLILTQVKTETAPMSVVLNWDAKLNK